MNMQKRQRVGMIGSVIVHCAVFLIVSFFGLFNLSKAGQEDIVEISMFGGGGGGGQGDELDAVEDGQEEEAEEAEPEVEETPPETDDIFEGEKEQVKETPKPKAPEKKFVKKSGRGTGQGSGTGSGVGPGSGSGSGGGIGSGHGTGMGAGVGEGIYSAPAVPPRLVRSPYPAYPRAELNAGIQGTVVLKLLVDTSGKVENITVDSSSGNANLDKAAINACYKWKFTSARNKAGQNVRCYMKVPITFMPKK